MSGQLEEHVFQCHGHRFQFEQPPSTGPSFFTVVGSMPAERMAKMASKVWPSPNPPKPPSGCCVVRMKAIPRSTWTEAAATKNVGSAREAANANSMSRFNFLLQRMRSTSLRGGGDRCRPPELQREWRRGDQKDPPRRRVRWECVSLPRLLSREGFRWMKRDGRPGSFFGLTRRHHSCGTAPGSHRLPPKVPGACAEGLFIYSVVAA